MLLQMLPHMIESLNLTVFSGMQNIAHFKALQGSLEFALKIIRDEMALSSDNSLLHAFPKSRVSESGNSDWRMIPNAVSRFEPMG